MTRYKIIYPLYLIVFTFIANSFFFIKQMPVAAVPLLLVFLFIEILSGTLLVRSSRFSLRVLNHGNVLLSLFIHSLVPSAVVHIWFAAQRQWSLLFWSALFCVIVEAVVFWSGIVCVYITSLQLGIKQRVIGIICGMIPIANLIALSGIIRTTHAEVLFEEKKDLLNKSRADKRICATKYPLLFVHGVFFRDSRYFNYWGRIPAELTKNGAVIYYGNHPSAMSVADSAAELCERIKEIVNESGCEKLNIIAHSKGGLDCRYAIEALDAAPYVASLTTVSTPHRGCLFADHLLTKIPENVKNTVAGAYNASLRKFGDKNPDFLAAVGDLTAESCSAYLPGDDCYENIYTQSVGSTLKGASGGKFPLNFSYHLVKYFDGANDGLVSESSFAFGQKHTQLVSEGKRGISHGDMIDLNRENVDGFDVREFYVGLVCELKERGL